MNLWDPGAFIAILHRMWDRVLRPKKNVKIYILQKFDLVPGWSIAYLTANLQWGSEYRANSAGLVFTCFEMLMVMVQDLSLSRKLGVVCYYNWEKVV